MTCDVRLRHGFTTLLCASFLVAVSSAGRVAAQTVVAPSPVVVAPPNAAVAPAPVQPTAAVAPAPVQPTAAVPAQATTTVTTAVQPTAAVPAPTTTVTTVTTPAQPVAVEPAAPPKEIGWDLLHRRFNTWNGPTGGLYLLDGRSGEPGAVRVQLGLDGFTGSSYLHSGDHIQISDQLLSISGTVNENFELFATLSNRTANQTKPGELSLDAIGDVSIGAKVGGRLGKVVDLGADLRGTFLNKVGGTGFEWGATSLWLRTALSIDLQGLDKPVPFIARFNAGYMLDNSSVLVRHTENARYDALNVSTPKVDETTHLISRFERLAMNVNRFDRFTFGAGLEAPFEVADKFYLHPIVEWQLGLPVNRQNYNCPFVASDPLTGKKQSAIDGCYERSPSVIPMDLAVALRVVPPVRGLSALIGVDIGLSGTNKFVSELTPNFPWRIMFALSYDYDARPVPPPIVIVAQPTAAVVATPVVPMTARVQGIVTSPEGLPIPEAVVRFPDRQLTALSTGGDGRFSSEPLPPGPVAIDVSATDYEPGHCVTVLAEGGVEAEVRCTLTPKPLFGQLQGQVVDAVGNGVNGAHITISGPTSTSVTSDDRGAFMADKLSPGAYKLRVEASGYFAKQATAQVDAHSTTSIAPSLVRKPLTPTVVMHGNRLETASLAYKSDTSTELTSVALEAIAEISELMLARTDLYLQVQGFGTDAVASARALLIKQRLVDAGVAESHVEAVGGGKRGVRLTIHQ